MKIKSIILITGLLVIILGHLKAQMAIGVVYEKQADKELVLPGVNVYWAGSSIGTITDENGAFELFKPSNYGDLVFSFVGYQNDTLKVEDNLSGIRVVLIPGENIGEVLITERSPGAHIERLNPIITQRITGVELKKAACCNLSESFETNASVDAYYANAATGAKQIRLLGLDGQYVQMLTENIPNLRGLAMPYGLLYIPGTWMETIQISKGTSSVKNGYESVTGQINVEYLKPETADRFIFNALANSVGRKETNIVAALPISSRFGTLVMAHLEDNQQRNDHSQDGFMDHPLVRQFNFLNRWKYTGDNLRMQFGVKAIKEDRTSGQMNFYPDEPRGIDLPYGIGISTERIEGFMKIAYLLGNDLNSNFGSIYSFNVHKQDSYFGLKEYNAVEQNLYVNLMFQTDVVNQKHMITSGVSLVRDMMDESLNGTDLDFTETVPGMFSEYSFNPNPKLTLLAGLRLDFSSVYGLAFTPRIHGRYSPGASTTFRLSAGKGYRTPHVLAEQNHFLASSRRIILEDSFDREEAWNYGINMTQYVGEGPRQLTLSIDAHRTSFLNQVIMDLDSDAGEVSFYNLEGASFSNNYQVEAFSEVIRGLEARLALRYTDVQYDWHGEMLVKPLVSKYKGLVNFSYMTELKKWQFDYTMQINGPGRIPSTQGKPVEYQIDDEFPAFVIMNAQITKYFRTWNIYAGAENLTGFRQERPVLAADNPYGDHFDASLIWGPVDGRMIYIGVRFNIEKKAE